MRMESNMNFKFSRVNFSRRFSRFCQQSHRETEQFYHIDQTEFTHFVVVVVVDVKRVYWIYTLAFLFLPHLTPAMRRLSPAAFFYIHSFFFPLLIQFISEYKPYAQASLSLSNIDSPQPIAYPPWRRREWRENKHEERWSAAQKRIRR